MLRALSVFVVGVCANVLVGLPAFAQSPAEVTLTRIDCGTGATPTDVGQRFTDTFAYKDLNLTFTFSCYLIKHGNEYMVWDTGFAPGTSPNAPKVGIVDRLKELNVTPEQVKYVGISHFHGDHTGQLAPFTNATLLIGKGDWDGITAPTPMQGANVAGFKSWIGENRKVEPLTGDKDVFGDGSVIVPQDAGSHAGPQLPAGQAEGHGPGAAHRRPGPLPRELRQRRGAALQLRPRRDGRLDRAHEADRRQPEGDRRHPARHARHRQAAGVPSGREVGVGAEP